MGVQDYSTIPAQNTDINGIDISEGCQPSGINNAIRQLMADVRIAANPIGVMQGYAGATAPEGWLLCYGQAVSRTTYADLFTVIGTTYGSGDGSTTFNIPDRRGRVGVGKDNMGGVSANRLTGQSGGVNGDVLGAAGGAETHRLTVNQMPRHNHSGSTDTRGEHRHSYVDWERENNRDYVAGGGASGNFGQRFENRNTGDAGNHSHGLNISHTGNDDLHNNVQPSLVENVIIYTGVGA